MAYDNTMKIEFYKPKYNLDIKFDGDDSFDLLFKNVSGELFFSASVEDYDSYVSFEDEECKFTNGELVAKVNISDLMETIANGQLRNTNGTTYGEWIPRIVGDYKTEHDLVFDGKTYADRGYWELFFKEMSKDEIKDFIEFCRDYIDIPNLEFSSMEFDFNNDNIVVNGKGYSITINDDLTIEMAEKFTCKSSDVVNVWESNHDYGNEFEEKKSARKSIKESTNNDYWVFAVYPLDNGYLVNTDIKDYQYMEIKNGEIVNHSNSRESWFANKKKKAGYKDFDDYTDEELLDRYEKTVRKIIDRLGILTESKKSAKRNLKENRFDDIIRDVECLLLDPRVLKSIEGYEKDYTELAYMLAERLDPNDYAMDEDGLAREIKDMLNRGKIKITESKKSIGKGLKESSNVKENIWVWQSLLNHTFNFTNWICRTFARGQDLHDVLERQFKNKEITLDEFVDASIKFMREDFFTDDLLNYIKEYLPNDEKIKKALKINGLSNKYSESKKSIKESVEFYNDFGTGVYCATSSNGWTFCYCPLSWINKKGFEDLIGWSVMDDKAHYIDGDSWENKTDEEINDSIDNFEKLIKKYAKEDAKEIIKDFRSTLEK